MNSVLSDALDLLAATLSGDRRAGIVEVLVGSGRGSAPLERTRAALCAHALPGADGTVSFAKAVKKLDDRTREDGFRVLHSWDHNAHRFSDSLTPVLMLDYFERFRTDDASVPFAIAVLLDYYLLHLLALCAMRAWDAPEPDEVLDRVTELVADLQGPHGSGHRFVQDAESLVIYSVSQFHPEEHAYDRLIDRFAPLRRERRTRFARASVAVLSSHLRWGFWLMYDRDVLRMRKDNVGDYPWLLDSVTTLLERYAALVDDGGPPAERADLVDALILGLAADPWAFTDSAPKALVGFEERYGAWRALLERCGGSLLGDVERARPSQGTYSPLALHFNFPHNTLVALVALALHSGSPGPLPLDELFVHGHGAEDDGDDSLRERVAHDLMAFSRESPDRLGYGGAMLVAYDPYSGLRSYTLARDALRRIVAPAE